MDADSVVMRSIRSLRGPTLHAYMPVLQSRSTSGRTMRIRAPHPPALSSV
jgi:hypothetical protein